MSESIPYLGSKISLISKSEIRYEGILYTIDAQESIIALAKVQSFGTEDRPTEMPVPAKNEIYEYIIFRGTDIKKIEVCETPKPQVSGVHNDPAIVGLQVQQQHSNAPVGTSSFSSTSFGHQPLGPIGSVGSFYGNYGNQLGQNMPTSNFSLESGVAQPSELPSSIGGVSVDPQSPSRSNHIVPAPIGAPPQSHAPHNQEIPGSRSSTPSISRKSPVVDAGVQVSPQQQRSHPQPQRAPQMQDKKRISNQGSPPSSQLPSSQTSQRFSRDVSGNQSRNRTQGGNNNTGNYYNQGQLSHAQQPHQQEQRNYQGYHQYQRSAPPNMNRGRPGIRRGGPSRGRPGGYQGTIQRRQQYEKEFDFEQANEEFEELRTQLAKTKIGESSDNGDEGKKDEKKEDSGHETATTGDESEDSNSSTFYDKKKSFFDNISCEALERSKGKSQRSDWRQERKINVQTFGIASARRGYFPRGRGGYYPRGSGGIGGGYYSRSYNQGGGGGGFYRGGNHGYRNSSRGGGYYGQMSYGSRNSGDRHNQANGGAPTVGGSAPRPNKGGEGSYASALRGSGSTTK